MAQTIECPITPVEKEIREGTLVHSVPERFHQSLAVNFIARKRVNGPYEGVSKYSTTNISFVAVTKIEDTIGRIVSELTKEAGFSDDVVIEFHSGWRYSVTTLENERRRYATKDKEPSGQKVDGGMLLHPYRSEPPERIHAALLAVLTARY